MRITLFILFISITTSFAQLVKQESFETLMTRGKAEFKKEFEEQNFTEAVADFRKAVALKPENPEAHYFLGYAYSRLNAKDGSAIVDMNLDLNYRSSEELEQVIQLTPKYTGELVVLDPYSKLTAEWGSMAMCYANRDKTDSMVWAFNEGKRRGGFSDFFLNVNRKILSQCSKHAILISSGDNMTFSLWYLQTIQNYRPDVTVIDISLLNTTWYPQFIRSKSHVAFDQPQAVIDTMEYLPWKDSSVTVRNKYAYKDFSWKVSTPVYDGYLQRSDQLFLSILKANEFESDVYFTIGFSKDDQLGLKECSLSKILVSEVNTKGEKPYAFETYLSEITKAFELTKSINMNSQDQIYFVDNLRYDLILHLEEQNELGNKKGVKQLIKLLDTYTPEDQFPYWTAEIGNYVDYLRKQR
ncbi:MAG: hypothetical protein JWM14_2368 [Chitinophagaceae bacterium]|nr:hypothetical protein [Chitinophagaceae bacterium]